MSINQGSSTGTRVDETRGIRIQLLILLILIFSASMNSQVEVQNDASKALARRIFESATAEERFSLLSKPDSVFDSAFFDAVAEMAGQVEPATAIEVLQFVRPLTKKSGNQRSFLNVTYRLGKILFEQNRAAEGDAIFQEALKDGTSMAPEIEGKFKIYIGSVYKDGLQFETAIELLRAGREMLRDSKGTEADILRAQAAVGIAASASEMGAYTIALRELATAEEIFTRVDNKAALASIKNEYGILYDLLQNAPLSERSYEDAIAMFRSFPPSKENEQRVAVIQVNLGLLQTSALGEYDEALRNFNEAQNVLAGNKAAVPLILMNKSIALRRLGRVKEGLQAAKEAFDQTPKGDASIGAKYKVGNAYSQYAAAQLDAGDIEGALNNSTIAISLLQHMPEVRWVALTTKANALNSLKRMSEARAVLEDAIKVIEDLENEAIGNEDAQSRYFSGMFYAYYLRATLELKTGNHADALLFAERAKAKVILAAIRGVRNGAKAGLTPAEITKEDVLTRALSKANRDLFDLEQSSIAQGVEVMNRRTARNKAREELELFHLGLYKSNPEARTRRGRISVQSVRDLYPALSGGNTVGVHYIVTEEAVQVLVVNPTADGNVSVQGLDLSMTGRELKKRVAEFRSYLEPSPRGGFRSVAKDLYQRLIHPISRYLDPQKAVALVPDGSLWDLPFSALINDNGSYFVETHTLFLTPSLSALSEMKSSRETSAKTYKRFLLALGDPEIGSDTRLSTKSGSKLGRLRGARALVNGLCKQFGSCDSTFTGRKASEQVVKDLAPGSRIVQLSAHGIFENSSPLYSHIVLAPTSNEPSQDGLLESWEIMNIDLRNTELIVLSACETGRGKHLPGEGLLGLTWATFVAGSPTIVATQWNVDDTATGVLMRDFYTELFPVKRGRIVDINVAASDSKAGAMRKAMIKMIRSGRYSHPSFWAGSVVVGNDR